MADLNLAAAEDLGERAAAPAFAHQRLQSGVRLFCS